MGLPAPCRGEGWGSSTSAGLTSFTFSMGAEATSGAVAASMLGCPRLGSSGRFSVGGEGGAEHLLSSLSRGPCHRVM